MSMIGDVNDEASVNMNKDVNAAPLAQLLLTSGAVKFGEFVLTSGRKSTYYVDVKKASTKPGILSLIGRQMAEILNQDGDCEAGREDLLAGMELGAVPIVVALALETGIPFVILRKGKREHGTGKQIEGEFIQGHKALIVEDVATTGGSIVRSAHILRKAGLVVKRSLVVVDREEGAGEALREVGIELVPLVKMSQIRQD